MNFEWALNAWIGNPSPVCIHARQCGRSLVIEHNGDVYSCDHYVYPQYRLGNIVTDDLGAMAEKSLRSGFGMCEGNSPAALVQGVRRAGCLSGRLPQAPLYKNQRW